MNVRKMYHDCKLVHGDLSEYNMLYHQGKVFIIDVSQSVEHDHPHALEFLRKDLCNVTEFFRRFEIAVLGLRELFDWVVDTRTNWEERLDGLEAVASSRTAEEISHQQTVDEEVFKQVFIPRRLNELARPEDDIERLEDDCVEYRAVTGICKDEPERSDDEEEDDIENDEDETGKENKVFVSSRRPKGESKEEKAERKKAFKEAQKVKREENVAQRGKKRREKSSKSKNVYSQMDQEL